MCNCLYVLGREILIRLTKLFMSAVVICQMHLKAMQCASRTAIKKAEVLIVRGAPLWAQHDDQKAEGHADCRVFLGAARGSLSPGHIV